MESKRSKIVVRANLLPLILTIIISAGIIIYYLGMALAGEVDFTENIGFSMLIFIIPLCICIGLGLDYKNRRIVAYEEGLMIRDRKGKRMKIGYGTISSIRITSRYRAPVRVQVEVEGETVICFYSSDADYDIMMGFLEKKVPDTLVWDQESLW